MDKTHEQMNKDQDRLKEIRAELMIMANSYSGDDHRACVTASFLHDVSNRLLMPIKALRRETDYDAFPNSYKNDNFSDVDHAGDMINNEGILRATGGMMDTADLERILGKSISHPLSKDGD